MELKPIKANMTELTLNTGVKILFSYQTPVAAYSASSGWFTKTSKFWSKTTSRHINQWLNGNEAVLNPQEFFDNLRVGVK
jgi:hypothetical protein